MIWIGIKSDLQAWNILVGLGLPKFIEIKHWLGL